MTVTGVIITLVFLAALAAVVGLAVRSIGPEDWDQDERYEWDEDDDK